MTHRSKRHAFLAAGFGGLVMAAIVWASASRAGEYFIDYAQGRDTAPGTSPTRPWQHAPGDPAATGLPAKVKLAPDDIVRFKGGVAYRGFIRVNAEGAPGHPITFTGQGYGPGRGIVDGAEPVESVKPCRSAEACGGAANWQKLSLVNYTQPPTTFIKFFDAAGGLYESQVPRPADQFFSDEVDRYSVAPSGSDPAVLQGRLRAPNLARLLAGRPNGDLSFWVYGNLVDRRRVTGVQNGDLLFEPNGLKLQEGGPAHYALLGAVAAISAPGDYAVISPGVAVVQLREGAGDLTVGNGRGGFDASSRSNITISGFLFTHQTAEPKVYHQGMAIYANGVPASGLIIADNTFQDAAMWNGEGSITLRNFTDVKVLNNRIQRIERGSGIRVSDHTARISINGNAFNRLGRTGIAFLGVTDSEIVGNVMTDMRGVHGNGISLYLANRRIKVADNRVTGSTRPITFHGDDNRPAPGDHDFLIERNIFIATADGHGAVSSWGMKTRGVILRNNLAIAPDAGFSLNAGDTGLVATNNVISGVVVNGGAAPQDWRMQNNRGVGSDYKLTDSPAGHASICAQAHVVTGSSIGGWSC